MSDTYSNPVWDSHMQLSSGMQCCCKACFISLQYSSHSVKDKAPFLGKDKESIVTCLLYKASLSAHWSTFNTQCVITGIMLRVFWW